MNLDIPNFNIQQTSDQYFLFQIKWIVTQNIKFRMTSRNHAYFILKALFHMAQPQYYPKNI